MEIVSVYFLSPSHLIFHPLKSNNELLYFSVFWERSNVIEVRSLCVGKLSSS